MNIIEFVSEDFPTWCERLQRPKSVKSFFMIFLKYPEFRRLLDYRFKCRGGIFLLLRFFTYFTSLHINLYISDYGGAPGLKNKIGKGLFFQHGFSTIIFCKKIGENCFVNQQVTIGYSDGKGVPEIGNNVRICAGAKVIGNVTVGDNVIIGANSVVTKDVPSNSMVAGIPAVIIKKFDLLTKKWVSVK